MLKSNIKLPVNEYFLSIQGEGYHTGQPAFFLRFGKCNLNCSFCDTRSALTEYYFFGITQILSLIKKHRMRASVLVLTGGEPALYNLTEIIVQAKKMNLNIHVETNGTLFQDWLRQVDWVTVSPKKEGRINPKVLALAKELKFVIEKKRDIKFAEKFMPFTPAYLMPVDNDKKISLMISEYLSRSRYKEYMKLGIQLQKVYGFK